MQILLSFLSGFGPRKAKHFIQLIKKNGGKVTTRDQIFQKKFLGKFCFYSSVSFMKIRVPQEDMSAFITTNILDQTRIKIESYSLAFEIAWDAYCDKGQYKKKNVSEYDYLNAVRQVIANPEYLAKLNLHFYQRDTIIANKLSMVVLIDLVNELKNPFKDPRIYRNQEEAMCSETEFLNMLIRHEKVTVLIGDLLKQRRKRVTIDLE
jgi:transcriptional accessory protein Tex/SPT6